jgi:hypothetical protein
MTDVPFGRLEPVDIRTAWTHEALHFTPWLATNLDRLSEALGIPLELERAEAPVGRYSADIFARNPRDGSTVLIENQLEVSDHTHLGQIMTYLTGLEAQTIVWVAPNFREEHRSAIKWLNEHTVDPFAFFAVRVRVVRIGDSAMAPLFEVLEQPNGWDRRLQEVARETKEASPIASFRKAFWAHMAARQPASGFKFGSMSSQWLEIPGRDMVVSAWISQDSVGVFVRGGRGRDGAAVAPLLEPDAARLEPLLGAPFGAGTYPFNKVRNIDLTLEANWNEAADWLVTEAQRYAAVLGAVEAPL